MWIVVIFAAIFAAISLVLFAFTSGSAARAKQTLARLNAIRLGLPELVGPQKPVDVRLVDTVSTLPWLNWLLQRVNLAPRLQSVLRQADLEWTVGKLVALSIAWSVTAACVVYLRTDALLLALCIAAAAGAGPLLYVLRKRGRRFNRIRAQLPDAIDLMVAAIRAGHSLNSAIGMVSRESPEPVRGEFRQFYDEQNFGLDVRTTIANLVSRLPLHDVRVIGAAILIQKDTGGNLAEILEKVAYLIREDFRLQRQVGVHTAQGRLTGYMLAVLPVVLGIGMYLLNPKQMSLLWTRPVGLKMLYGATISTTIGVLIIRKIVRIRV